MGRFWRVQCLAVDDLPSIITVYFSRIGSSLGNMREQTQLSINGKHTDNLSTVQLYGRKY